MTTVTVLQGKVESKGNQGRPPRLYIDNVKVDSSLQLYEVIHQSRDRGRWRPVVASNGAPRNPSRHLKLSYRNHSVLQTDDDNRAIT